MGALASREARSAALRTAAAGIVENLVEFVYMEGLRRENRGGGGDGDGDDGGSASSDELATSSAEAVAQLRRLFLKGRPADERGADSGMDVALSPANRAPPAECESESESGSHCDEKNTSNESKRRTGGSGEERFRVERTPRWREETATRIVSLTAHILASMAAAENPAVREAAASHCGRVAVEIFTSLPSIRASNASSDVNADGSKDEVGILGALLLLAGDESQGVADYAKSALASLGCLDYIWSTYMRDGVVSLFWSWLESIDQVRELGRKENRSEGESMVWYA